MTVALVLVAVIVGYTVGRARPWSRLSFWAIDEIRFGGKWASGSKARQVALLAMWAVTTPRDAVQTWRGRNDPAVAPVEPVHIVLTKSSKET